MILTSGGEIYGWGSNVFNQLGAVKDNCSLPVLLNLFYHEEVERIVSRADTCFARLKSGDVYAWGRNNRGQFGTGDEQTRVSKPVKLHFVEKYHETQVLVYLCFFLNSCSLFSGRGRGRRGRLSYRSLKFG